MSAPHFRRLALASALVAPGLAAAQEAPVTLPTLQVIGATATATGPVAVVVATQSAAATKTDTPILETPRSISVVTADEIQQRVGAQTIGEALNYTAGVFSAPIATNRANWTQRIRAFSAYQSGFQDGLADPTGIDRAQPQIEPFGAERVEVLKGPSSVLYGQIQPGGLVNVVSKRPIFQDSREAQFQLGSFDRYQSAFDVNGLLGDEGAAAWRLVGLGQLADSQVEFAEDNRLFIAPSFT